MHNYEEPDFYLLALPKYREMIFSHVTDESFCDVPEPIKTPSPLILVKPGSEAHSPGSFYLPLGYMARFQIQFGHTAGH